MKHTHAAQLMDRAFADGLGERQQRALRDHLDACADCRARYDRLARAGMAARAVARGEQALSAELDQTRLERLSREFFEQPTARNTGRPLFSLATWGLAGVAATVLVAIGLSLLLLPADDGDLGRRGMSSTMRREDRVGIRVFTLDRTGEVRDLRREAARHTPVVEAGAALRFAYTNFDERVRYLALCTLDHRGELRWLFGASGPELAIGQDVTDRMLDLQLPLETELAGRSLRLYALFAERPIERTVVEMAARALRGTHDPTAAARLVGLDELLQDSLLIEVVAAPRPAEDAGRQP